MPNSKGKAKVWALLINNQMSMDNRKRMKVMLVVNKLTFKADSGNKVKGGIREAIDNRTSNILLL